MKLVNERTTVTLALQFTDENGRAVIPNSGEYQVTDELTGTVLVSWTGFTPTASTYSLVIAQTSNRILDDTNESEVRVVSIITQYATSTKQCTEEFKYEVSNLSCVPAGVLLIASGGGIGGGATTISGVNI